MNSRPRSDVHPEQLRRIPQDLPRLERSGKEATHFPGEDASILEYPNGLKRGFSTRAQGDDPNEFTIRVQNREPGAFIVPYGHAVAPKRAQEADPPELPWTVTTSTNGLPMTAI
ncbi:MAG TPA: hypothetical protein VF192_10835 [Longimicrobiales bacterium]